MDEGLAIGSVHSVKWRGEIHKAKIVEKKRKADKGEFTYYVHYLNYDRRLDEWIDASTIDSTDLVEDTVAPAAQDTVIPAPLNEDRKLTRNMKRKFEEMNFQKLSEIDPKMSDLEKEREEITKVRNINTLQFGKYLMQTWYFSPYPDEYKNVDTLYVCEFCLKYMKYPESLTRHQATCKRKRPPGRLVYGKDTIRAYEVDGKEEK
ncbi:acyl-CoA N-acyltransferase, partial [Blyttiomyces helicus]